MSRSILGYFGLGKRGSDEVTIRGPADEADPGLMVTGEELIASINENIRMRRSVLVTGPRGCGKTYCSEAAIRRARDHGLIGGWRFLQGNREIPRDTLSEDMLVVAGGKVESLKALALRPLVEDGAQGREGFPDWPGIPTNMRTDTHDPRVLWTPRDWIVLFLDEINRFGDGFLDSLLALVEEGKIVRRGQDYYVPIIVVATANPPGYDVTAKKLSPPLQARITRAFRVSQPDAPDLVREILPSKIAAFAAEYPNGSAPVVSEHVRYLAAGATLCLWGDPDAPTKGNFYLTGVTRERLRRVMKGDKVLAASMRSLADLIDFGPDARAVGDWIGCAMALAARDRTPQVNLGHLERTCIHVLGHKLRERFNEGADPGKGIQKDRLLLSVVQRVFAGGDAAAFGHTADARAPAPVRVAATLTQSDFMRLVGNYPYAKGFAELLGGGQREYSATLLRTEEVVLVWLNLVDAVLHPYATPEVVHDVVTRGFWSLYRAHAPGQQLDAAMLEALSALLSRTFAALQQASNPAGRERAAAAVQYVQRIRDGALQSPGLPENAPARSGIWGSGPQDW